MRRWCCSAFSSCPPFHLRLLPSEAGHLTSFCCPPTCSFPQCFAYESNLRSHLQSATFVRKSKCFCYAFKVGWCCPWGLSFQHLALRDFSKYLKKIMILAQRRQAFGILFISADLSWLLRDTWPSLLWPFSHDTPRFSSYLLILVLCYSFLFTSPLNGDTSLPVGEGNGNPLQYSCLENPWTEEPDRVQSIGSQRAGHDWETITASLPPSQLGSTLIFRTFPLDDLIQFCDFSHHHADVDGFQIDTRPTQTFLSPTPYGSLLISTSKSHNLINSLY